MSTEQPSPDLRLRCRLNGCCLAEEYPGCVFCGAALYDHDFIQEGWLAPLQHLIGRVRFWWRERRWYCGKRVTSESTCLLKRGHPGDCDDIPF